MPRSLRIEYENAFYHVMQISWVSFYIDFENYGWDDPNISDINGFFDAGADETYGNDIIFQDGFN